MSQIWTKNKPDRAGHWWVKHTETRVEVVKVVEGSNGKFFCIEMDWETPTNVNSSIYKDSEWGSAPIPEPSTRKY
jgi:hypothetical protein